MSSHNFSDSTTHAIDVRQTANRNRLAGARRKAVINANSKVDPKLVSNTLCVCNQGDKYFLDNSEVWITSTQRNLDEHQVACLKYNQYLEAIKSLIHNINFIISAQNFGAVDKKGKTIDINHIKSKNFNYNVDLRTIYGCSSKRHGFIDESQLNSQLIKTLESSQKIVEALEKELISILSNFTELEISSKLAASQETKKNIFDIAKNLTVALQNNNINLDAFADAICFEKKKESSFNRVF